MRFEEPSSMVRWDSPLFSIAWDDDLMNDNLKDEDNPDEPPQQPKNTTLDDLWMAVTTGSKKGPTAAVASAAKPPPDALQVLAKTISAVVTALQVHISLNPSPSPPFPLITPNSSRSSKPTTTSSSTTDRFLIHLPPRSISPSELQRLKRQFEGIQKRALISGGTGAREGNWTEEVVGERFGRYLMECWGSGQG
jgi:protein KTI12